MRIRRSQLPFSRCPLRGVSWLFSAVLLLSAAASLCRADPANAFEEANRLYAQGKFAEAATNYAELITSGRASAAVYFNLGNAHFKAGHLGQAIGAYRNAEKLTPRDPDIQANLRFARNRVQGPTSLVPAWQRALGQLSLNEWTVITTVLAWIWLGLLTLGQCRPTWRPVLRKYVLGAGIATLVLAVCLAAVLYRIRSPLAIVAAPEAVVRQAPLAESDNVFVAQDGAELPVIDRKGDWLQVSLGRTRSGWIRRDQVLMANHP